MVVKTVCFHEQQHDEGCRPSSENGVISLIFNKETTVVSASVSISSSRIGTRFVSFTWKVKLRSVCMRDRKSAAEFALPGM